MFEIGLSATIRYTEDNVKGFACSQWLYSCLEKLMYKFVLHEIPSCAVSHDVLVQILCTLPPTQTGDTLVCLLEMVAQLRLLFVRQTFQDEPFHCQQFKNVLCIQFKL